jgi:hypothetical protein
VLRGNNATANIVHLEVLVRLQLFDHCQELGRCEHAYQPHQIWVAIVLLFLEQFDKPINPEVCFEVFNERGQRSEE